MVWTLCIIYTCDMVLSCFSPVCLLYVSHVSSFLNLFFYHLGAFSSSLTLLSTSLPSSSSSLSPFLLILSLPLPPHPLSLSIPPHPLSLPSSSSSLSLPLLVYLFFHFLFSLPSLSISSPAVSVCCVVIT